MKRGQRTVPSAWRALMQRLERAAQSKNLTPMAISLFRKVIYYYYKYHGRRLPWRETENPYHILISEVMLQQTQVDRVLCKYRIFIEKFPDFHTLAHAPLREIMQVWQGLGYNRRALALKQSAQLVVTQYNGQLPAYVENLRALPGVGKATASAIAAFAFNRPVVFIETNIRTVFLYFFFRRRYSVTDREILPLIARTMDRSNPRVWYHALMDFGVMLKKTQRNPSRRSAHYTTQSPFKGSNRQLRGKILNLLTHKARVSELQLLKSFSVRPARMMKILGQLQKEHLIKKQGRTYSIP